MNGKKICLAVAAAVLLIAAAILSALWLGRGTYLVLRDGNTGREYARYPVEPGEECSVEFIHSVNRTPVRDVYEITEDGRFHNVRCIYYGFGAGVQTQLEEGETLSYQDGAMVIDQIEKYSDELIYSLIPISTHVLRVGEETVSLPELVGGKAVLSLTIERHLF